MPGESKVFRALLPTVSVAHWWIALAGGAKTSKAEEYRANALECEARAEQTRDPFIKQQMIDIAEKWRNMAAYEEKNAR
jgi:hypothetical protein